MPTPASAIAAQVRAASRCPSATRATSAVNSGAIAIVTSTLATVVSVIATMKAVYITAQQTPDDHSTRPPSRTERTSAAGPRSAPSSTTSAAALKRLRQKVTSKLRAASRWRVTTPAMLHIRATRTIRNTARRCVIGHFRGPRSGPDVIRVGTPAGRGRGCPFGRELQAVRPRGRYAASREARLRSCSFRWRLRTRIDFGVISTSSSSAMNSTAYSSVRMIGGVILIASSLPETRKFVELLAAHRIHDEVVVARVDADHHALVERIARLDEHAAAVVELAERVRHRLAVVLADQHAVLAPFDVALEGFVAVEDVADQAGPARQVQELVLEADQSARRDAVLEAHTAHAVGLHVDEFGLAFAERLHDRTLVLVLDVGSDHLDRLVTLAVDLVEDHTRLADGQLVALAAHVLEQDRQVQFAAPRDLENAVLVGLLDA